MDDAPDAAAAIARLLSLAVQIAEITQRLASSVTTLPPAAVAYREELVSLKRLLGGVQDAVLLQSASAATTVLDALKAPELPAKLARSHAELEHMRDALQAAEQHPAWSVLKSVAWPFLDGKTVKWSELLRQCRECIQTAFLLTGLDFQATTLQQSRDYRRKNLNDDSSQRILDWICDDAMRAKHKWLASARHPGTGQWILSRPEFQNWFKGQTRALWCYGRPGVGKTQLMSTVVDHVSRTEHVLYFYCDHQTSRNQGLAEVAPAFLRQLVEHETSMPDVVEDVYRGLGNGNEKLELDDVLSLFRRILPGRAPVYVVLDALDEYASPSQRWSVLSLLKSLADGPARVLISSRPQHTEIGRVFSRYSCLEIRSDMSDVRSFVEHTIGGRDELSDIMADGLSVDAVNGITNQAAGTFLLATLHCARITRLRRASQVREALGSLPGSLEDAYEGTMHRIQGEHFERLSVAMAAFSWLHQSKRQLSTNELLHALAFDPDRPNPGFEDTVSLQLVLDACAGLVVSDAESSTVRFAHHSVREYFAANCTRWFPQAREDITRKCVAYLFRLKPRMSMETGASWNPEHVASSFPLVRYAAWHWGSLARDEYHDDVDIMTLDLPGSPVVAQLVSLFIDDDDGATGRQALRMYPGQSLHVQLAARVGASHIANRLLELGCPASGADPSGRTALHWAARGGFGDIVEALLRSGAYADSKTEDLRTPLQWAARHGHADVVMQLARNGANPGGAALDGRTALHWAASRGHGLVVKGLLADTRVLVERQSQNGWTPLHRAACSGRRAAVARGRGDSRLGNLGTGSRDGLFTFTTSSSGGHEDVVALLLAAGADPNSRNTSGQTPLHLAAASGNSTIVKMLLDGGADIYVMDRYGYTPLSFAARNDADEWIVRLLSDWAERPEGDTRPLPAVFEVGRSPSTSSARPTRTETNL